MSVNDRKILPHLLNRFIAGRTDAFDEPAIAPTPGRVRNTGLIPAPTRNSVGRAGPE